MVAGLEFLSFFCMPGASGNYSARMRGFLWKVESWHLSSDLILRAKEAQLADARRAWRHNYGWSHDPRSTEAIRKLLGSS